jgi:anti-anti-sigma factor
MVHMTFDRKAGSVHAVGEWRNSYEAEIHLASHGRSDRPVCHTLTGYASGYSTSFLKAPVLTIETKCMGMGDPLCVFEIKPVNEWGPEADPWREALDVSDTSLSRDLERQLREIEQYRQTIASVGTPIIQIWPDVVVVPIIGAVDATRGEQIMEALVHRVADEHVRSVLLDLTGVESVDTHTADLFVRMARSVRLLGSRCILTGIRPEVAHTLVSMGAHLEGVPTYRSLGQGLEASLHTLGYSVARDRAPVDG